MNEPIEMDVTEHRAQMIFLHGIQNANEAFTFYYDETENLRKLYLKESASGVNTEKLSSFVLGGIAHRGTTLNGDVTELFERLKLPDDTKFKSVAKGDFLSCLKSPKVTPILRWLIEHDVYIHYTNLNVLFWSLVDIVDSMIYHSSYRMAYIANEKQIKSQLNEVAKHNGVPFLQMLYRYGYPNIKKEHIAPFLRSILQGMNGYQAKPGFEMYEKMLRDLLEEACSHEELPFIEDVEEFILIDSLCTMYARPIFIFKNSHHVFDDEPAIEEKIDKMGLTINGKRLQNYEFKNSKDNRLIQLSDVVVGLLGKYFSFINDIEYEDIDAIKAQLNPFQAENIELLKQLYDNADEVSNGFFLSVCTVQESVKHQKFLHNMNPI